MDSSVISSVGYDDATAVLEVEFHTGRVYRYASVPVEVYEELLRADSIGDYFNREIRSHYAFVEIVAPTPDR